MSVTDRRTRSIADDVTLGQNEFMGSRNTSDTTVKNISGQIIIS